MEFLHLSQAALEWLLEEGGLEVSEASPFGFLLRTPRRFSPKQRAAAAETELAARGVTPAKASPPGANGKPPGFESALRVLARPEALLRITISTPAGSPAIVSLFTRGDQGSVYYFDQDGFNVGSPVELTTVAASLEQQVQGPGPLEGEAAVAFWPSVLATLTQIWTAVKCDVAASVRRSDALARMGSPGPAEDTAGPALDELVQTGVLQATNGDLSIPPRYRPWLQLVWSGHLFQVNRLPLPAQGPPPAPEKGENLLFVGPPGRRVYCRDLTGAELMQKLDATKQPPPERKAIELVSPPPDVLGRAIGALLRRPASAPPAAEAGPAPS